ncbi:MAG: AarF/UbiB family protein [Zunongwangia sp.]|uniref:ABC1 kinase family protein n=1 Tax=Zunongwangia sp. TaxID=1965325 RepID=UPI00324209C6
METNNSKKLKRTGKLLRVLTKYGFEDIFDRSNIQKIIPQSVKEKNQQIERISSSSVYERIRMVMEELGPTYVKFGQMFSNRTDLFPKELIIELQKLQDKVGQQPINIREKLEVELNIIPNDYFEYIDEKPLASASMAQVFTAVLKNGEKVALKIRRENIKEILESDLLIMKDLVEILENYDQKYKKMNLSHILDTFGHSIHRELSLSGELANIERFHHNFREVSHIYVPTVYRGLSNDNILCMEFIQGIKITDKDQITVAGFEPKKVAVVGFDLYMKQILEHGFFHADPHPGNIFVTHNGEIAFIDFGAMGTLLPNDRELLEDFFVQLSQKNIKKLIATIKEMSLSYAVTNERVLERGVSELIEMTDAGSLKNINLKEIAERFRLLFHDNQITLPEHFYLLLKGIAQIEGIGRHLDPDLDVYSVMQPYANKIFRKRISPKYWFSKSFNKLNNASESLLSLPDDIKDVLHKIQNNEIKVTHAITGLDQVRKTADRLVFAIIISALSIGSAVLVMADMPPKIYGVPVLGFFGFLISAVLGISIAISILRTKSN